MTEAGATEVGAPVSVAVLGLGNAGRRAAASLASSPHCRLEAVCDLDATVAGAIAEQHGVRAVADARALARDADVEAVFIATPTHTHLADAVGLAGGGKHLMVEKPVTKSATEGQALVELAEQHDVRIMAVNTRGRDAPVRAMARLVRAGVIGRPISLTTLSYTNWTLKPRYPYELVTALGGGVVFRQAPHQIEIARAIIDSPVVAVTALLGSSRVPTPTVGNYNALLEFASGASATLVYNGYGYFDTAELTYGIDGGGRRVEPDASVPLRAERSWDLDKYGEAGLAVRHRSATTVPEASRWGFAGFTLVSGEAGDLRQTEGGITVYDEHGVREEPCDEEGGLPVDFEELHAALRLGRPLRHDARWGAATVAVSEAIWRSGSEGRRVTLAADEHRI